MACIFSRHCTSPQWNTLFKTWMLDWPKLSCSYFLLTNILQIENGQVASLLKFVLISMCAGILPSVLYCALLYFVSIFKLIVELNPDLCSCSRNLIIPQMHLSFWGKKKDIKKWFQVLKVFIWLFLCAAEKIACVLVLRKMEWCGCLVAESKSTQIIACTGISQLVTGG